MAWRIELTPLAEKSLNKPDPQIARRIFSFLHDRLAVLDDPRSLGEALKAPAWESCENIVSAITGSSVASKTRS